MKLKKLLPRDPVILVVFFIFMCFLFFFNSYTNYNQQFSYLANSWLSGKLYFVDMPGNWLDTVMYGGHHYWPLGPFPIVILLPFVYLFKIFNIFYLQGYLNIFLVLYTLYLAYKLARKFLFSKEDSIYLTFAFIFSSVYFGVAMIPISWWFSHIVVVLLLMLFMWEYLNKKRINILVLLAGLTLATRFTAGIGPLVFLFLDIVWANENRQQKIKKIISIIFSSPLLPIILLLFLYNYWRFGNFLEFGYNWQIQSYEGLEKARSYGIFSLTHLPGNLYYAFLASPIPVFKDNLSHVLTFPFIRPDNWGLSLFFTSPWFFLFFFFKYSAKLTKMLWITIIASVIPIFLYFGIGVNQYGYRYILDLYPFIYLLFLYCYSSNQKKLSSGIKILFLASSFINMYLYMTFMTIVR